MIYGALPLFHVSGTVAVVMQPFVTGCTSVLDPYSRSRSAGTGSASYKATVFIAVGPMIMMLCGLPPDPSDAELPLRLIAAVPIPARPPPADRGTLRLPGRRRLRA